MPRRRRTRVPGRRSRRRRSLRIYLLITLVCALIAAIALVSTGVPERIKSSVQQAFRAEMEER